MRRPVANYNNLQALKPSVPIKHKDHHIITVPSCFSYIISFRYALVNHLSLFCIYLLCNLNLQLSILCIPFESIGEADSHCLIFYSFLDFSQPQSLRLPLRHCEIPVLPKLELRLSLFRRESKHCLLIFPDVLPFPIRF